MVCLNVTNSFTDQKIRIIDVTGNTQSVMSTLVAKTITSTDLVPREGNVILRLIVVFDESS